MTDTPKDIRVLCPICGSKILFPIIDGKPSFKAYVEGRGGAQSLGDCAVDDLRPNYYCKYCQKYFYICG